MFIRKHRLPITERNIMIKLYIKGGFYYCYGNDSIIISYLCNYKIVNNRVGFPINSINKVVNILVDNKIDYIIYNKDNVVDKYISKDNRYYNILIKAKSNIDINNRINNIVSSLYEIDTNKLNIILEYIERVIYE